MIRHLEVSTTDTRNGLRTGFCITVQGERAGGMKWWMGSRESALREARRMEAAGEVPRG